MIRVRHLDWASSGGIKAIHQPTEEDVAFVKRLDDFCKTQLAAIPNLSLYRNCWVAYDDKSGEIHGIAAWQMTPDVQLFRVRPSDRARNATAALIERVNSFFNDNGARGQKGLIYISSKEGPEQKCSEFQAWLKAVGAVPADRYEVEIR